VATFHGASPEASRKSAQQDLQVQARRAANLDYDFRVSRSKKSAPDWLTTAELTITGLGRESTQQPSSVLGLTPRAGATNDRVVAMVIRLST
jgi:hypothetical protein